MKDIDYFYERDLDRTNILDYDKSLPSHLHSKFRAAIRVGIAEGNVLQGYRGPSNFCNGGSGDTGVLQSSHGVQEIRFWWGARKDINAIPIVGTGVFGMVRVVQHFKGHLEWGSLYFDSNTGECLSHNRDEAAERLNHKGRQLFKEGKYTEAAAYYSNAYNYCSTGYRNKQTFKNNRDATESHIRKENDRYERHRDQIEADAIALNCQGFDLLNQGKCCEAYGKFKEAYNISLIRENCNTYRINRDRAQTELDAINLNSQGDHLFREGKYSEAYDKYQEAYQKSAVSINNTNFLANRIKAQTELDAISLNSQGDNLFKRGKYNDAHGKYQEAYDRSQVVGNKHIYAINKDQAQTVINTFLILDTLWNEAWNAENDTENDRSAEAKKTFQEVLSRSKNSLENFSNILGFKKYETIAALKLEGNELFNHGIESQQNGIKLLQEARELKQQQKYELADIKFQEAKGKFSDALEKFKIGSENDQRFLSCIEFVEERLNEVIQSIEITKQYTLSQGLNNLDINISNDNRVDADFSESDSRVKSSASYEITNVIS